MFRMKDFMKTVPDKKTVDVYLRYATPDTYRSVLNEIKNMEIYNMLVDTKSEHVDHFLRGVSRSNRAYSGFRWNFIVCVSVCFADTATPDERLQIPLSLHVVCKYPLFGP